MNECSRGQIWLVALDPAVGHEIQKTRPALIVSNDINNRLAGTITVVPITDAGEKVYPFEVFLPTKDAGLKKDSKIKCQQIRTVDKSRLIKRLGFVSANKMLDIERAIKIHLGMN